MQICQIEGFSNAVGNKVQNDFGGDGGRVHLVTKINDKPYHFDLPRELVTARAVTGSQVQIAVDLARL